VVSEAFNDDGTMPHTIWYDQPGIGGIGAGAGINYIQQALRGQPTRRRSCFTTITMRKSCTGNPTRSMPWPEISRSAVCRSTASVSRPSLKFDDPAKLASYAKNLERFATLGLELDIRLGDSSPASFGAQAKLYGEITALCVQQPTCKLVQTWGFTDKHSWIPNFYKGRQGWALLWDDKYRKKPAYSAVHDALTQ
jgi:hypothetical protein